MQKKVRRKTAIVFGAGGFIGHHLVRRLKKDGYWVRGVDVKYPEFEKSEANDFMLLDLTDYFKDASVLKIKIEMYIDSRYSKSPWDVRIAGENIPISIIRKK